MVAGAVVIVGIAVAAFLAGRSSDSSAGGSDAGALDAATTLAAVSLDPVTTASAPAILPPTTAAVVAAPVTTTPPTTPPPIALVSYDEAVNAFSDYLYLAAGRSYEAAWADLTPRYQVKYLGYDNFVRFWETVDGAGVVSSIPVAQLMNGGYTIRLQLWFGRRVDGTTSNEIVEVDLIRDPVTGAVVIDDYRYIRAA